MSSNLNSVRGGHFCDYMGSISGLIAGSRAHVKMHSFRAKIETRDAPFVDNALLQRIFIFSRFAKGNAIVGSSSMQKPSSKPLRVSPRSQILYKPTAQQFQRPTS